MVTFTFIDIIPISINTNVTGIILYRASAFVFAHEYNFNKIRRLPDRNSLEKTVCLRSESIEKSD